MIRITTLLIFTLYALAALSQDKKPEAKDSVTTTVLNDSLNIGKGKKVINIESYAKRFNPRKALLYAAILPGAGQAYNNKYWKIPIVYGGFIALGRFIGVNQDYYTKYKIQLFQKLADPNSTTIKYTVEQLRNATNRYRRDRDYLCIMTGVLYALQMVDAHVDAHLKEFDINPQLKARIEPTMENDMLTGRSSGISLKLKF